MDETEDGSMTVGGIHVVRIQPREHLTQWTFNVGGPARFLVQLRAGANNLVGHLGRRGKWEYSPLKNLLPDDADRPALTVDAPEVKQAITEWVRERKAWWAAHEHGLIITGGNGAWSAICKDPECLQRWTSGDQPWEDVPEAVREQVQAARAIINYRSE
ncbi:hypothetical protein [Kutzneria chonburiensis]|uniref:Uncharacterized protein n=1 Tax=Kutzneria chonburiensis TaxID=1483604 RepID=A0ABV6N4N3_9PSEU|nr:hypothetical protein [Kutzneria chonburiensis]